MLKETERIYSLFWKDSSVIHCLFKRKLNQETHKDVTEVL